MEFVQIIESVAVFLSIVYVYLAARESIWCWPPAFISSLIFVFIFFQAKLYQESFLHVFYAIMAVYGFILWKGKSTAAEKPIQKKTLQFHLAIILSGFFIAIILGFLMKLNTDAELPFLDSFTTIFAIIATFMVTKKILANWIYFIVIDLASIYMYIQKDLYQTAILYLIYITIAIFGYNNWVKNYKKQIALC